MSKRACWFLLVAACGGGARTAPATTTAAASAAPAPTKESIDAFHDLLAPLWHAPESSERTEKTCAAVPDLERRAQAIGDAPLVESIHALEAECAGDRAAFQPRFSTVHDAFHAAMEKGGVAHDEEHAH
jgi:hypothetical protein